MSQYSKEFLEKTIKVWEPYHPTPMGIDAAKEIIENMIDLMAFITELERKYGKEEKNLQH